MAKEIILPFSELKGTLDDTPIEPTLEITENGVYNVKSYVYADVNVGGGGESDFSTARVTVITTENGTNNFSSLNVITVGDTAGDIEVTTINSSQVAEIVLYKGLFEVYTNTDTFVSVTGNATYEVDEQYGDVTISITGDCTITINPEIMV